MEHVDAEQLELEERLTDAAMKPDPTGVGYQLRAYWNATVQEAVEHRFNLVCACGWDGVHVYGRLGGA